MKTMRSNIDEFCRPGLTMVLVISMLFVMNTHRANAQDIKPMLSNNNTVNYDELERIQDKIEDLSVAVYKIRYRYPDVTYHYVSRRGETPQVEITGMPDNTDRQRLHDYLIDLQKNKNRIFNLSNRVGVYYVTETDPEPKDGYEAFYANLYRHLDYPETAMEHGVEGAITVRFIVDENGQVKNVTTMDEIKSPYTNDLNNLRMAAKNAVKETSGDWIPAKAGGRPVQHWVSIPVEFKIENPLHLMPM